MHSKAALTEPKKEERIMKIAWRKLVVLWLVMAVGVWGGLAIGKSDVVANGGMVEGTITLPSKVAGENVIVYLKDVPGEYEGAGTTVDMDQKGKKFLPHVLPVLWGTDVRFINSDAFLHNVHGYIGKSTMFNQSAPAQKAEKKEAGHIQKYNRAGEYLILCDVHPEMEAYVVSFRNPFFVKVKEDGSFKITGVPDGTYQLAVWSPEKKLKPIEVTVTNGICTKITLALT